MFKLIRLSRPADVPLDRLRGPLARAAWAGARDGSWAVHLAFNRALFLPICGAVGGHPQRG